MKNLRAYFIISLVLCICIMSLVLYVCISPKTPAASVAEQENSLLRVYEVNKRVCDFPDKEDFSTPETAYAVINRVMASGEQGKWRQISVKSLADRLSPTNAKVKEVKPEYAKVLLNARILEVRIFREQRAVVLAELMLDPDNPKIDKRYLELENGRWLNKGQDPSADSLEEARAETNAKFAYMLEKPSRPKIKGSEAYLKPFVEFLKNKAEEPKAFVMKVMAEYKVTIIGEIHHRPRYWAFNSSLVTEPDFPQHIGTIYLELPSNDQELVDQFLDADKCDTAPVIEMLRDNLWMGWPDQAMLDFFITVWMVNQNLEPQDRLQIVLVDMQRPWSQIEKRQDLGRYSVNRDKFMAENILKDLHEHPQDKRNTLFIVGVGHTALNFEYFEEAPVMTAGWYLRQRLGPENVYAVFQHRCVQTNMGRVDGRLCLGLFDSAFAAVGNKPMIFPLDIGPFGKEQYDAAPDRPVSSTYKDGFNAYLHLGPLETEIFSPLIAGFYTDDFVKELERRYQLMYGKGWADAYRQDKSDAESFIKWMGTSWGRPRRGWHQKNLGPINAWHLGGRDWKQAIKDEKVQQAVKQPEIIEKVAKEFFDKLCQVPPIVAPYQTYTNYPKHRKWIKDTFTKNPIVSVKLDAVFLDKSNRPAVPYKLILKDGTILEGVLPFLYDAKNKRWYGTEGIDWHLQSKNHRGK
ncbi:MAG: hypothetical protein V3W45_04685 [Sedimentisphaerales bacterium]